MNEKNMDKIKKPFFRKAFYPIFQSINSNNQINFKLPKFVNINDFQVIIPPKYQATNTLKTLLCDADL